MTADVQVVRLTGAGPTATDVTGAESVLSAADTPTPTASDYLAQPAPAATTYSRWGTFRLNAATAPDGTIDNLRAFTTGDPWDALGVILAMQAASSYVQATSAVQLSQANHAGLVSAGAAPNADTFTEGSPLTVAGSTTGTGQFGNRVVVQVQVSDTAIAQDLPPYDIVIRRDET